MSIFFSLQFLDVEMRATNLIHLVMVVPLKSHFELVYDNGECKRDKKFIHLET